MAAYDKKLIFYGLALIKMNTIEKKLSAFDFDEESEEDELEREQSDNELEESDSEVYFYYNLHFI